MPRFLTALPVFNEVNSVSEVLDQVRCYSEQVLVVDDGSTDGTREIVTSRDDIRLEIHENNLGYGAALATAFRYAAANQFDFVVTIDCDGQHEPQRIPRFVQACENVDIVSGSRYLKKYPQDNEPPAQRRWINQLITKEINRRLNLKLTDAFCGFKAYRVSAVANMEFTEAGYAMPLELWVNAAAARLKIVELPVPLIYLDEKRSFGGVLDDGETRLKYYREILDRSMSRVADSMACQDQSRCWQGA
jgi:dolichol-phosphate mannosyltransferase